MFAKTLKSISPVYDLGHAKNPRSGDPDKITVMVDNDNGEITTTLKILVLTLEGPHFCSSRIPSYPTAYCIYYYQ